MYIINKEANRIEKIETATFKQLGFRERDYLMFEFKHQIWKEKIYLIFLPL